MNFDLHSKMNEFDCIGQQVKNHRCEFSIREKRERESKGGLGEGLRTQEEARIGN